MPHPHTEEMNTEAELVIRPRRMGDNLIAISTFFQEGKKGKAVIFSTPEGNFLSPKAVENLLESIKKQIEEDCKLISPHNEILKGILSLLNKHISNK